MTAIEKAQEKLKKMRESGQLERMNPIEKAQKNPKSLRMAINGKCWDCCGTIKAEITHCQAKDCTLWAVRPYQV